MLKTTALMALLMLVTGSGLANLLVNGDFEQPMEVGWEQDVYTLAGSHSFDRWDTLGQPTPGHAARVYKYLAYHAAWRQKVDVPGPGLTLVFDARLRIGGGSSTCWPTAAMTISYLDDAGGELGTTMYLLRDLYNTWQESDTLNFHEVTANGTWEHYQLDIAAEIAQNLPGFNAADVRGLELRLFAYDNGT